MIQQHLRILIQPITKSLEPTLLNSHQDHNLELRGKGHLLQTRPIHQDIT